MADADRWVVINSRLAALGLLIKDAGEPAALTSEPRMSPHQWERLLTMAQPVQGGAP